MTAERHPRRAGRWTAISVTLTGIVASLAGCASNAAPHSSPTVSVPATTSLPATLPPATTTTALPTTTASTTTTSTTTTTIAPTTTTAPGSAPDPAALAAFDAAMAGATTGRGDLSMSLAIVRNGAVLHTAVYGHENPFEGTPTTTTTRFRLASVSKVLTAIVVMQLVDEGRITLDAPFLAQLGRSGPFVDPRMATITVRQLLAHTSGFGKAYDTFFRGGSSSWQQSAEMALNAPLQSAPGTDFHYSNSNYCLLGLLIEHVTGDSYARTVQERVLEPLHAVGARMAGTQDHRQGEALYPTGAGRTFLEALGPAGAWVATPSDIAVLLDALAPYSADDGRWHPLPNAATSLMRTPQPAVAPDPNWTYGLGTLLYADGSWGHTGSVENTHAVVVHRLDGLTVAVFVSGNMPWNTDELLVDIAKALPLGS